jgi:hypothetical protein
MNVAWSRQRDYIEIPNKKLESLRCSEIGIGPVEGRSASSILQFLNLAEGTLSVKGLVASGELKSAGLNAARLQGLRQTALTTAGILGFHHATFTVRKLNDGPARRYRCTMSPGAFHDRIHADRRHVLLSFLPDGRIILVRPESFFNNRVEDAVSLNGFGARSPTVTEK